MKNITLAFLLAFAWVGVGAPAQVGKKPAQQKIAVSTHLERTAIWVGDTFRYTIQVLHDPDIEFVLESLKKESLNLSPFVVRDVGIRQDAFSGNKRIMEVSLLLATYEIGQSELRIPPLILYYFTRAPGATKAPDTPAEAFTVPAAKIGLRSALGADALKPRDSRDIFEVSPQRWMVFFVLGLAGIAFVALAVGRRLWTRTRSRSKPKAQHLTRRARNRAIHDFLRNIQGAERGSREAQIRFCSEVSRFVREYLGEWLGRDVSGLTPAELASLLQAEGRAELGTGAKTLLEKCERVIYAPPDEQGRERTDEIQRELGALTQRRLAGGSR